MENLESRKQKRRAHRGEEGVVLLMVILLVVMFSGLGLLAMRRVQGEARSAGAYMDSTQAAAAAESAIMMVATDIGRNWDHINSPNRCPRIQDQYDLAEINGTQENMTMGFSDVFNSDADCSHRDRGTVPLDNLRGAEPLAATGGPLANGFANVTLRESATEVASRPPPGNSQGNNFRWLNFTVTATAAYGFGGQVEVTADTEGDTDTEFADIASPRGNAVVQARMMIGPLPTIGSNGSADSQ